MSVRRCLILCLLLPCLLSAGGLRTAAADSDDSPAVRSISAGSGPQLLARIVDGAQDFDEWHELEIELSVTTDGSRYLVRRLRVLPSDEVEPECSDIQRMGRLVLPAQGTTVLPPLELEVSERQRNAWLKRLLQRQHRRYVVLALELQRLDAAPAGSVASTMPLLAPATLSAAQARCPDAFGPDDQQYEWLFATLPVLIDTPPWSMHVGAVIGAVLSTLFVFLSARKGETADTAAGSERRPRLQELPGELLLTSLACLIAVMLLQSTSSAAAGEAGLPLQVAVKDFYGGLLIGLFGRQIVGFVRRRLSNDPGTMPAPAALPAATAAVPVAATPAAPLPLPDATDPPPALPAPGTAARPPSA